MCLIASSIAATCVPDTCPPIINPPNTIPDPMYLSKHACPTSNDYHMPTPHLSTTHVGPNLHLPPGATPPLRPPSVRISDPKHTYFDRTCLTYFSKKLAQVNQHLAACCSSGRSLRVTNNGQSGRQRVESMCSDLSIPIPYVPASHVSSSPPNSAYLHGNFQPIPRVPSPALHVPSQLQVIARHRTLHSPCHLLYGCQPMCPQHVLHHVQHMEVGLPRWGLRQAV